MTESKDPKRVRLRMVIAARRDGVKPTAGAFGCSPNTVRQWLGRFDGTLASLSDRSRAPRRHPNAISEANELEIVQARTRLPTWGARRLKRDMQLPYSVKTIARVFGKYKLARRWRRKKHEVKHCLRHIKRNWALWRQITVDTKDLTDLPEYMIQARSLGLPRYQYTAREVSTGALFLGYAGELSLTYAELFIDRILAHVDRHDPGHGPVTVQTDNGSEFVGSWQAIEKSAFTRAVERHGAVHRTIPPGQHRWQSDVETVHSLMELEFFLEEFDNRTDFIRKANTYQHFFNYVRTNSGKENCSPWKLIQKKRSNPNLALLYLPTVFLEDLLYSRLHPLQGVQYVGVHPSRHSA
jgi:transposase